MGRRRLTVVSPKNVPHPWYADPKYSQRVGPFIEVNESKSNTKFYYPPPTEVTDDDVRPLGKDTPEARNAWKECSYLLTRAIGQNRDWHNGKIEKILTRDCRFTDVIREYPTFGGQMLNDTRDWYKKVISDHGEILIIKYPVSQYDKKFDAWEKTCPHPRGARLKRVTEADFIRKRYEIHN